MAIDCLAQTEIYVEKKQTISIKMNKNKNNKGVIKYDELNNDLISIVDSGNTLLQKVKKYPYKDKLMLFNPTTNNIELVGNNETIKNISIDFIKGTKYFIGAKKLIGRFPKIAFRNDSFFVEGLKGLNVFKIFLDNGIELKNYKITEEYIEVKGIYKKMLDSFSQIVVYCYDSTEIIDNEEIIIEYNGYPNICNTEKFLDGSYFSFPQFRGREVENLTENGIDINENTEKQTNKYSLYNRNKSIIQNNTITFSMELFNTTEHIDIFQYIGSDEFRLVCVNVLLNHILLINDCFLEDGISISLSKPYNKKRATITCNNYIDMQVTDEDKYGNDIYSKGIYSGYWVTNSNRKGV